MEKNLSLNKINQELSDILEKQNEEIEQFHQLKALLKEKSQELDEIKKKEEECMAEKERLNS